MTNDAVQAGSGSGSAIAGWPLRRKLALLLAIPLLLATVLGGMRVSSALGEAGNASRSANQVTVLQPAVDYLASAEAAMVAAQRTGGTSQGDLIDAVADIDSNASALKSAADEAELNDRQAEQVAALLDLSQAMRTDDAPNLGPATWVAQVRQLESSVNQLVSSLNAAQNTPEPRLEQLSQAVSGRMSLAQQQALVTAGGQRGQSGSQELFTEIGVEASAIDRLAASLGSEPAIAELRSANTSRAAQIKGGSDADFGGRDAYAPYDIIIEDLIAGVTDSLNSTAGDARASALSVALATLATLGVAIAIAILIARSLLDSIGRVREGALAVARHRLPDAVAKIRAGGEPEPIKTIDVTTNEEIGQVARAVDDLHRQALHLAAGEASLRQTVNAMFVTLSRRSNSLVNQQLAQIERLEHDEEDPKRLESLFRLDHLASRMRRTADSLLILADAPNRAAGTFSLTVGETLQAATSGVQDYQRVQIISHLSTRVGEDAAADVVHLLTELVDNALTYSPPSEPVKLDAKLGPEGVLISVADSGLGVPASELESLNADLSHGSEATPDTARRMGLFVVSRLARRHGIDVALTRNPRGGMTATVLLPATVLPELPQPAVSAPKQAAEPAAAPTAAPIIPDAKTEAKELARRARAEKAVDKAARQAEAKEAGERAAAAKSMTKVRKSRKSQEPAPVEDPLGAIDPDRPPLSSLQPRREPGANLPRTGAEAFLPPETSAASGPLFGKKKQAPEEAAPEVNAEVTPAAEAETDGQDVAPVAPVVPITALAARQRAQAEEAAAEEPAAEEPVAEEPVVEEPVVDPLGDPLASSDQAGAPVESEATPEVQPEVAADSVQVDEADPLGLDGPPAAPEPEPQVAAPEPQVAVVEPDPAPPVAESGLGTGLADLVRDSAGGLPSRAAAAAAKSADAAPASPAAEPGAAAEGGESPIFKSMRSGWLAAEGEGEWHKTEVDRGWEIAENVAEEAPAPESTSAGLPVRQPGQRLVPGSVTPPTESKVRDPEAIRRRLSAHRAGVARGRKAATNSTQHTEAGPA